MPSFSTDDLQGFLARLRWRYRGSLRVRLIALSLGLFITFLWVLVFLSSAMQRQEFSEVLFDQQFASVRRLAADLDSKLGERIRLLTVAADSLPDDLTPAVLDPDLRQLLGLDGVFSAGIAVIGLDGIVVADFPVLPGRRGTYVGDRNYFTKMIETGKPWIDSPIIGRVLKRPVLTIAVPVFDRIGNLRAVMIGLTDLTAPNFLGHIFDQAMSGLGQFFVISPRDNLILAATAPARRMTATPARGTDLMYDRFVAGFEGSGIATGSDGIAKLYSAVSVPTASWLVLAALPEEIALQPVNVMRNYLLVMAVILTLLAALIIHWVTGRMFAPLDEAGRALQRMTHGEAPLAPLPVKSKDEIGGLIDNFNVMVADHHRSEEALTNSEQRLRALVENAPDALFVQTRGCFAYVNAAAVRLFGANAKEELLGQSIVSRVHPDLRVLAEARMRSVNEGRETASLVEHKLLRLDGSVVYAEVSAIPYFYENENGALVFARDITERKRADEALRESEERFHRLVALSSEWYWECDEKHRLSRIAGWKTKNGSKAPEHAVGLTPGEMALGADDATWSAHRAIVDAHLPFTDFEYMRREPDGSLVWHSVSGEPMFAGNGAFKGYRGTGKDITERKLGEEALRQSQARIRELAAHQEEIKEEERKRIARDIHDELGQTLLTMRFDASMLAERTMSTHPNLHNKARRMLDHIDTAMKSVKAIINDLRPFVLDLGLVAAIEWQVHDFQRRSRIECELEVDDGDIDRYLDESRSTALFRISQESLTNISRHAEASRVDIAISTKGDRLTMTIADNGIGIAPDGRNKKNAFGLVGIEERITALGGTFAMMSARGKGTTLILSVPLLSQARASVGSKSDKLPC